MHSESKLGCLLSGLLLTTTAVYQQLADGEVRPRVLRLRETIVFTQGSVPDGNFANFAAVFAHALRSWH